MFFLLIFYNINFDLKIAKHGRNMSSTQQTRNLDSCVLTHPTSLFWRLGQFYAPAALYPWRNSLILISVSGWVDPRDGRNTGHLKTSNDSRGNPSRNLPSCGAVPQTSAPFATSRPTACTDSNTRCLLYSVLLQTFNHSIFQAFLGTKRYCNHLNDFSFVVTVAS
jgi:hypothetical protein